MQPPDRLIHLRRLLHHMLDLVIYLIPAAEERHRNASIDWLVCFLRYVVGVPIHCPRFSMHAGTKKTSRVDPPSEVGPGVPGLMR